VVRGDGLGVRRTLVCPACGSDADFGPVHVHGEAKGFERYHCDACGADMLTEDLVKKSHIGVYSPRGQAHGAGGGSLTSVVGGYPHVFLYFPTNGAGSPILTAPQTFDTSVVADLAKFDWMTLNISPFTNTESPLNINIVSMIKAINPNAKIVWYGLFTPAFQNLTHTSQWGETWDLALASPDKRLKFTNAPFNYYPNDDPLNCYMDWTASGVATAYADIWTKYGERGGDGYFFDLYIPNVSTGSSSEGGVDYAARGYGSAAALDSASATAHITAATRVGLTGKPTYCNRGSGSNFYGPEATGLACTGEFIELFFFGDTAPDQISHFGTFDNFMTFAQAHSRDGGGGTNDGTMILWSDTGGYSQGQNEFHQNVRFTLGSACLIGARAGTGQPGRNAADRTLRSDEWAVTSAGATDTTFSPANHGWLGRPTGSATKVGNVWVRNFANGIVIVNGTRSSQSYTLPGTFRKINGAYDTGVNNGASVSGSISIPGTGSFPGKDARFLLRT